MAEAGYGDADIYVTPISLLTCLCPLLPLEEAPSSGHALPLTPTTYNAHLTNTPIKDGVGNIQVTCDPSTAWTP